MFKKLPLILLPILAAIVAYFPSLQYGFSQDDFINLYSSHASNIGEFLNFFNPYARFPDIFIYRPLSTQVWYFLNSLFGPPVGEAGLNPLLHHLEALILHIANAILIYIACGILFKRKILALLTATLYALSAVHFISLYYISTFQELAKTFFMLLGVVSFSKKPIITVVSFILGLLSKENVLVFPFFLIVFEIFRRKEENWILVLKETLRKSWVLYLICLIYLFVRWSGIQDTLSQGGYSYSSSIMNILQNLKWYILWTFGLPEILSTYPNIKIEGWMQFVRDFGLSIAIVVPFVGLVLVTLLSLRKFSVDLKSVLFLILLWLVPLLPVLALDGHKYPQYLGLSMLPALSAFLILLISSKFKDVLLVFGLVLFATLQLVSLELTRETHWTTHRSEVAAYYVNSLKKEYPNMEDGTTIIFSGDYGSLGALSVDLAKDYGMKVVFKDKVKDVRYLNSDTADEVGRLVNKSIIKKVDFF